MRRLLILQLLPILTELGQVSEHSAGQAAQPIAVQGTPGKRLVTRPNSTCAQPRKEIGVGQNNKGDLFISQLCPVTESSLLRVGDIVFAVNSQFVVSL